MLYDWPALDLACYYPTRVSHLNPPTYQPSLPPSLPPFHTSSLAPSPRPPQHASQCWEAAIQSLSHELDAAAKESKDFTDLHTQILIKY